MLKREGFGVPAASEDFTLRRLFLAVAVLAAVVAVAWLVLFLIYANMWADYLGGPPG
jgi:predicted secreted protein